MSTGVSQDLNRYINNNYKEANVSQFIEFSQQLLESSLNDEIQHLAIERRFDLASSLWQSASSRQGHANKVELQTIRQGDENVTSLHIISDDQPFIVDSITNLLLAEGYLIKFCLHPVLTENNTSTAKEFQQSVDVSVIYFQLGSQLSDKVAQALTEKILALLIEIKSVTDDWPAMLNKAKVLGEGQNNGSNIEQLHDFMQWLCQDNFTFLGYYPFSLAQGEPNNADQESLGVFKQTVDPSALNKSSLKMKSKELQHFIDSELTLLISKSTIREKIHRHDHYDQVSVKQYSEQGEVIAIHRFIGLFTQAANNQNPIKIPYLQSKLAAVLQRINYKEESHNYKKFRHILKELPKREIFESNTADLFTLAKGIYNLNSQSKCGTFIRENNFNQQVSALVFVSKEAFCTDLRDEIESELCQFYDGEILSRCSMLNDNYLAQWHFTLVKGEPPSNHPNLDSLIARIEEKTQSWMESLSTLICDRWGDTQGTTLIQKYRNSFSKSYREKFSVLSALKDIEHFEKLNSDSKYQFQIYRNEQDQNNLLRLNIYSLGAGIALSDSIPILEKLGFRPLDEFSFKVLADISSANDLYSYTLECPAGKDLDLKQVKAKLEQALTDIWAQKIENDGYNKLLLTANINIRQTVIIRAYGKYLRQLGLGYSEEYFQQALIAYPDIVADLIALFEQRFSINGSSMAKRMQVASDISKALFVKLNHVAKIDHDRILRNFIDAISATVRTNFY